MTPRRILVIDDEHASRDALVALLSDEGFEVVGARDGSLALQLIDEGLVPDVMIVDWRMSPMGGAEFLRAVDTRTSTAQAARVVLTADDTAVSGVETMIKPVNLDRLLARIRELLAERAEERLRTGRSARAGKAALRFRRWAGLAALATAIVEAIRELVPRLLDWMRPKGPHA